MKVTTKILALLAATCGLHAWAGTKTITTDFVRETETNTLPDGWTAVKYGGGSSPYFVLGSNGALNREGWVKPSLYTAMSVDYEHEATIEVVTYASNEDNNCVIFLGSSNYSLCLGNSYKNDDRAIRIGTIDSNAASSFVSFQSGTGTNPQNVQEIAAAGAMKVNGSLTYSLTLKGTALTGTVTDANGVVNDISYTLPGTWAFTTIGVDLDCAAKSVGVKSISITATTDAYIIDSEVDYDTVKNEDEIYIESTGTLNLGSAFNQNKEGLVAFLAKVTGAGTIALSGTIPGPFPTSEFVNTGCSVKLAGVNTWIAQESTIPFNMILEDSADYAGLSINGANNGNYSFSGKITGSGNIAYTQTDGRNATFNINGDVSQWTGSFVNSNTSSSLNVKFNNNANATIAAGVINKATSGKCTVTYTNGSTLNVTGALVNEDAGSLAVSIPADKTVKFPATFGETTIIKEGDGAMVLTRNNDGDTTYHTQGTTFDIKAGSFYLGKSGITEAPRMDTVTFKVSEGTTLDNYGWFQVNSSMTLESDGSVSVFNNSNHSSPSKIQGNGTIVKKGTGTITVQSMVDTAVNVEEGVLDVNVNRGTVASAIAGISGTGTLKLSTGNNTLAGNDTTPIELADGVSLKWSFTNNGSSNADCNVTGAGAGSVLTLNPTSGAGLTETSTLKDLTVKIASDNSSALWVRCEDENISNIDLVVNTTVNIEHTGMMTVNKLTGTGTLSQDTYGGTTPTLKVTTTGCTYEGTIATKVILDAGISLTCANVTGSISTVEGYHIEQSGTTYTSVVDPTVFTVKFSSLIGNGAAFTWTDGTAITADYETEAGDITFKVVLDEDYDSETLVVKAGTTTLTPASGIYTATIEDDTTITATADKRAGSDFKDLGDIPAADVKVWAEEKGITQAEIDACEFAYEAYLMNTDLSAKPELAIIDIREVEGGWMITILGTAGEADIDLGNIKGTIKVKAAATLEALKTAEYVAYDIDVRERGVAIKIAGDNKNFMRATVTK